MPDEERSGDLLDVALADEIELVSDLVVAASSSPRHFTPDEVDALLGIAGAPDPHGPLLPRRECPARADSRGVAAGELRRRHDVRVNAGLTLGCVGVTTTP